MTTQLYSNIHWFWFGVGVFPHIKTVDIYLPFFLLVVHWGNSYDPERYQ